MADHTDTRQAPGRSPGSASGREASAGRAGMEGGDGHGGDRKQEIRRQAERVKDEVKERAYDAKDRARDAKESVSAKAGELGDEARDRAREVRRDAERKAERKAGGWMAMAGERTAGVANAVRTASDNLRDEGERGVADLADRAADGIDRVAAYLEDHEPSWVVQDVKEVARRHTGMFIGGSLAAGALLGRILGASRPARSERSGSDGGGRRGSAETRYSSPRTPALYGGPGTGAAALDDPGSAGRPGTRSHGSAEQGDYPAGASRPSSASAPASAGETLGSGGTVDPRGGPDIRPSSGAREGSRARGNEETAVPSPSGGAGSGQNVRTGSAGAASASAGSGPGHGTGREGAGEAPGGSRRMQGSEESPSRSGRIQSSGPPTPGTGAPTGDRKEKTGQDDER